MNLNIIKRPATPIDGKGIIELHNLIHPKKLRILSRWEWEFLCNPIRELFIHVAVINDKIISQNAILPLKINMSGEKILGGHSVDAMTHPNYMKRNIFSSLATMNYKYSKEKGVNILFAFSNELAQTKVINKLGWHNLGTLPSLIKFISRKSLIQMEMSSILAIIKTLNPKKIIKNREWIRILNGILKRFKILKSKSRNSYHTYKNVKPIKIYQINNFDKRFDELWERIKIDLPISIWKDAEYLNWRYFSHPEINYVIFSAEENSELVGYIVIKYQLGQYNIGYIIDLLFLPKKENVGSNLIEYASYYLKNKGIDMVICHIFEHSPFYQVLGKQGFLKYGKGKYFNVRWNGFKSPSDIVLDRKKWHLMEGDIDEF